MADHDQKVDKKMGQNDKNLIQDVAMEVKDKDKSKTQSQEDIEAKIEEGYVKLKGDINSRLTPLLQALTEAGVDGGLIASVEKEIHTNSRMLFFNRVMNSDINDMEEIRKLVQKESLQYLKPLFEDGEINHDEVRIASEYTKENLEYSLLTLFDKKEDNKEVEQISKTEFNDPWLRNEAEKQEKTNKVIEDVVEVISDEEFNEINNAAIAGDPKAKAIMVQLSTILSYGVNGKEYRDMDEPEKCDSLQCLYNYLSVCNMTNNPTAIKVAEEIIKKLNISSFVKIDRDGTKKFDLDALKEFAKKDEIELFDFTQTIETAGEGYEAFGSKAEMIEESQIEAGSKRILYLNGKLRDKYENGEISFDEIKKLLDRDLDATNRSLEYWMANSASSEKLIELYNEVLSHTIDANMEKDDSFWSAYVVNDLYTAFNNIAISDALSTISQENLQKFRLLLEKCQQYMERMPDEKGYGKTTIKKLEEAKMFLDIQAHTRQVFETEYAEFDSEEEFYEEMTIQSKYEYILKMSDSIQHEYENDNIDDVEIKNLLFSNIPAANRTLCAWVAKPNDSEKKQELYNKVVDYIIDLNMDSRGFDIYNVDDLYIVFNQISDINGLKTLTPENVEKFKGLFEKCKEYIEKNPEEQGYLNLTVSDLDKCQELLDNRDLNNRDVEIDEEVNFIVSPEYLAELDRQDAEREAQERDVVQKAQEQKKANMLKAMVGMTKAKGLVKSQEWMDNLITNYPDKELIAEAVVEFLEKQKETDEHFMDEDSKEARESVFESIVLSGIDNPEIFGRMQKIDRETSKVVVKNVIEQVNSSRSVLNNVVSAIQALGKNINEPEQEVEQDKIVEDTPLGFLKPEETELPKVDMFDNKHGNRGNEEPEDDWIR